MLHADAGQVYCEKADVYSFGIACLEMYMRGEPMWGDTSDLHVAYHVSREGQRPLIPDNMPAVRAFLSYGPESPRGPCSLFITGPPLWTVQLRLTRRAPRVGLQLVRRLVLACWVQDQTSRPAMASVPD